MRRLAERWRTRSARASRTGQANGAPPVLMLNMEDADYVDRILALRTSLLAAGVPVAQTLQAYLKRGANDLTPIIAAGGQVRLVKGAFADPRPHAHQGKAVIDANYVGTGAQDAESEDEASGFRRCSASRRRGAEPGNAPHRQERGLEQLRPVRISMFSGRRRRTSRRHSAAQKTRCRSMCPTAATGGALCRARRIGERPRDAALLARAVVSG